jgi:hypothetical protein
MQQCPVNDKEAAEEEGHDEAGSGVYEGDERRTHGSPRGAFELDDQRIKADERNDESESQSQSLLLLYIHARLRTRGMTSDDDDDDYNGRFDYSQVHRVRCAKGLIIMMIHTAND